MPNRGAADGKHPLDHHRVVAGSGRDGHGLPGQQTPQVLAKPPRKATRLSIEICDALEHPVMTNGNPTDWYIRDRDTIHGPLSEREMKLTLKRYRSAKLMVRQGESLWVSADVVRDKIDTLEREGIWLQFDEVVDGPFTLTRAHEQLESMGTAGVQVKNGRDGQWVDADRWMDALEKARQRKQQRREEKADTKAVAESLRASLENLKLRSKLDSQSNRELSPGSSEAVPDSRKQDRERARRDPGEDIPPADSVPPNDAVELAPVIAIEDEGSIEWIVDPVEVDEIPPEAIVEVIPVDESSESEQ